MADGTGVHLPDEASAHAALGADVPFAPGVERYGAIIDLPRPLSERHAPMSRENRAAQFAPFAALTGYGDCIREANRLTADEVELSEEEAGQLDRTLALLAQRLRAEETVEVELTRFIPDERKAGGSFSRETVRIRRFDEAIRVLYTATGERIALEGVVDIRWPEGEE